MREYLREARKAGFRVVMNESPLHVMMGQKDAGHEIYCQPVEGEPGKDLCPTYRGELYAAEMERVVQCVARTQPDFVFGDIECWHSAENSSKKCERCRAVWENFQKSQADLGIAMNGSEKMSEVEKRERFLWMQGREIVRVCIAGRRVPRSRSRSLDLTRGSRSGRSMRSSISAIRIRSSSTWRCRLSMLRDGNGMPIGIFAKITRFWGIHGSFRGFRLDAAGSLSRKN